MSGNLAFASQSALEALPNWFAKLVCQTALPNQSDGLRFLLNTSRLKSSYHEKSSTLTTNRGYQIDSLCRRPSKSRAVLRRPQFCGAGGEFGLLERCWWVFRLRPRDADKSGRG
jgi:hypothetical protein